MRRLEVSLGGLDARIGEMDVKVEDLRSRLTGVGNRNQRLGRAVKDMRRGQRDVLDKVIESEEKVERFAKGLNAFEETLEAGLRERKMRQEDIMAELMSKLNLLEEKLSKYGEVVDKEVKGAATDSRNIDSSRYVEKGRKDSGKLMRDHPKPSLNVSLIIQDKGKSIHGVRQEPTALGLNTKGESLKPHGDTSFRRKTSNKKSKRRRRRHKEKDSDKYMASSVHTAGELRTLASNVHESGSSMLGSGGHKLSQEYYISNVQAIITPTPSQQSSTLRTEYKTDTSSSSGTSTMSTRISLSLSEKKSHVKYNQRDSSILLDPSQQQIVSHLPETIGTQNLDFASQTMSSGFQTNLTEADDADVSHVLAPSSSSNLMSSNAQLFETIFESTPSLSTTDLYLSGLTGTKQMSSSLGKSLDQSLTPLQLFSVGDAKLTTKQFQLSKSYSETFTENSLMHSPVQVQKNSNSHTNQQLGLSISKTDAHLSVSSTPSYYSLQSSDFYHSVSTYTHPAAIDATTHLNPSYYGLSDNLKAVPVTLTPGGNSKVISSVAGQEEILTLNLGYSSASHRGCSVSNCLQPTLSSQYLNHLQTSEMLLYSQTIVTDAQTDLDGGGNYVTEILDSVKELVKNETIKLQAEFEKQRRGLRRNRQFFREELSKRDITLKQLEDAASQTSTAVKGLTQQVGLTVFFI